MEANWKAWLSETKNLAVVVKGASDQERLNVYGALICAVHNVLSGDPTHDGNNATGAIIGEAMDRLDAAIEELMFAHAFVNPLLDAVEEMIPDSSCTEQATPTK